MARTVKCPCGRSLPCPEPGGSVACPGCGKSISMPVAGPGATGPRLNFLPWLVGGLAVLSVACTAGAFFHFFHRPASGPASEPETPEERYALARGAFSSPANDGDAEVRSVVEGLVGRLAAGDAEAFVRGMDIPRLLVEMESAGRLAGSRLEEFVVMTSLKQGVTEDVGELGWKEASVARVEFRRERREADAWARVCCKDQLRNLRFRLIRQDAREWKVYDWDDLEEGERLSERFRPGYAAEREPGGRASYDRASAAMREMIRLAGEEKHQQVLEEVATARRLTPHPYFAHGLGRMEGNALLGLGRNEEALAAYGRALAAKTDFHFPVIHQFRGRALNLLGRHEESVEALREFLRQVGDDAVGLHWLGTSLESLGREDEAVDAYRRGAAADPRDVDQRLRLARLFLKRSDRPAALGVLNEAVSAAASRYGDAAEVLRESRAWEELLRLAAVILAKEPSDPNALLDRGRALRRLGRPREALDALRKGFEEIDGAADARDHVEELACAAAALGQIEESLGWAEKLRESGPDSARYRYTRARFRSATGRLDEALQDLDSVLEDEPWRHEEMAHEPMLGPLRGRMGDRLPRAKERQAFRDEADRLSAGPDWEKLLALSRARAAAAPQESESRYWEGYALRRLGRIDEAERALRAAGEGWGTRWELALALAQGGKTAEALNVAALFEAEEERLPNGLYLRLYALARAGSPEATAAMERLLKDFPGWFSLLESEVVFEELRKRPDVQRLLQKAKEAGKR